MRVVGIGQFICRRRNDKRHGSLLPVPLSLVSFFSSFPSSASSSDYASSSALSSALSSSFSTSVFLFLLLRCLDLPLECNSQATQKLESGR